jgi:hypothetical protein
MMALMVPLATNKKDPVPSCKNQPSSQGNSTTKQSVVKSNRFEGQCAQLRGYIFDCADARQSDMFIKTTKEIADYVGWSYKFGGDIRLVVEGRKLSEIEQPMNPPTKASRTQECIWEKLVDEYVKRTNYLAANVPTLFSLVWGQCSDGMRQQLEASAKFSSLSESGDGIGLLGLIKVITFNFQSQKYLPHSLHDAKKCFYTWSQGRSSAQAFLEQFQNIVDVIEHCGGHIGHDSGLIKLVSDGTSKPAIVGAKDATKIAQEHYLANAFILGTDKSCYGRLLDSFKNDYLQGCNTYPATLTAVCNLLTNWKQDTCTPVRPTGPLPMSVTTSSLPTPRIARKQYATSAIRRAIMPTNAAPPRLRPLLRCPVIRAQLCLSPSCTLHPMISTFTKTALLMA